MALFRFALQQTIRRPVRSLLTLASIVLAVASIVAVWIGTSSARTAYQEMSASPNGVAQYELVSNTNEPVDLTKLDKVYELDELKTVQAVVLGQGAIRHEGKRLATLITGIDINEAQYSSYWKLAEGSWEMPLLHKLDRAVWLEADIAAGLGVKIGDLLLLFPGKQNKTYRLRVAGTFINENKLALQNPKVVLDWGTHKSIFNKDPKAMDLADLVNIELPENEELAGKLAKVTALLPATIELRKASKIGELGDQSVVAVSQGMDFIMALSIGMSAFMILNSFLMNVSERRKQLAVLRAIGATRQQIRNVMLSEGFVLGVLGSVIGVPLGIYGAQILSESLQRMSQFEPRLVPLNYWGLAVAALAGPIVAVLGAYLPARAASRIHPSEGLSASPVDQPDHFPIKYAITAMVLWLFSGMVMVLVIAGKLPHVLSIPSGLILILAFLYVVPVIIQPLLVGLVKLIFIGGQLEKNLARQQLVRRHTRTVLTVGVLIVAVNSGIGSGNTIITHLADVQDWYRRALPGDYFMTTVSGIEDTSTRTDANESMVDELAKVPTLAKVETMYFADGKANQLPIRAIVRSLDQGSLLPLDVAPSDTAQSTAQFQAGEVICSSILAFKAKLKIGDTLNLELNGQQHPVKIAALTRDYNHGGMVLYLNTRVAQEQFKINDIHLYLLTAKPNQTTELAQTLSTLSDRRGLKLESFAEMKGVLDRILSGIQGAYWLLLVLGFIVAAFGIVNTMTMNILEQTHEIGLLRIIGMTRAQVRNLFLIQAALIGLASAVIGCVAGIVTAYIMQRTSEPILGYEVPFALNLPLVAICCVMSVVIGIVAAIWPIRQATQLEIQGALAYE